MISALAPVVLPLATALAALFLGRPSARSRVLVTASALAQLGVAIELARATWGGAVLVVGIGGWAASVGVVMAIDLLSALMLLLSATVTLVSVVYGYAELPARLEHPLRVPLLFFVVTGMNLAFITGDLFNLFVAFELMLIAAYALLTLEADDWDIKQAYPYVAINLVASTLFLAMAGLSYSLFGTLNFALLAERAAAMPGDPRVMLIALFVLLVGGIKAGTFPLYFWLPNSYPILPAPLVAFFAGMLTKVGVYVMIRMYATVLPHELGEIHVLLTWIAVPTMLFGVIGAFSRGFIRAILPLHSISQVGFMVLALGLFSPAGVAACIYFMIHHSLVKSTLFLVGGAGFYLNGSDDLERMGGLWRVMPWLGVVFLLQALSLSGLPPLSGFWAKYMILVEALGRGHYVLVTVALVTGVLTLMSMLKIWLAAFWRERPERPATPPDARARRLTLVAAVPTALAVALGLGAELGVEAVQRAASAALDRDGYVEAVLSAGGRGAIPRAESSR